MADSRFEVWVGKTVVLQVTLGDIKVPLRGRLVGDGGDAVRLRVGEGWDVDIYKSMIIAVEEDTLAFQAA
ncbi:MAG: hypothetical protein LAN61_07610 [Acidobacteriia bacterium]|nr:hypothetical protein [Terriglobia bacterium]